MHNLAIKQIWECSEFYRSTEQFTIVIAIVCCRCVLNSFLGKNQYSFCCVSSLVVVQYQAMYFNSDNGPFHHAHRTNGGRCVKRGSLCSVLWSFRLSGFLIRDSFRCSIFPRVARCLFQSRLNDTVFQALGVSVVEFSTFGRSPVSIEYDRRLLLVFNNFIV